MATPQLRDDRIGDGRLKKGPKADPLREYVAANSSLALTQVYRTLPRYIDDVTRDFGDDLYERMLMDPQVASCVGLLKRAILGGGYCLVPAVPEGEEGHEKAKEIADFCRRNLEGLARPFVTETLSGMLDALAFGNKVAEQIYELRKTGPDAGRLCLRALKVKPRRSVAFVVDAYSNVVGLLGLMPDKAGTVVTGTLVGDLTHVPNLLPRRKFAILCFNPKDDDPRGTSILRPAYHPWWMKMQGWPEYLKHVSQFGGASVIGKTAPNAEPYPETDENGDLVLSETGSPVMVNPEEAMVLALQEWRNGFVAAFPAGSEVDVHQPQGDGKVFTTLMSLCDSQIAKAILYQTLATEQAEHQARAAASTHQDVLDYVIRFGRTVTEQMIRGDILTPLVEYNFGPEAAALVPSVQFSDTEQQDFPAEAKAIADLGRSGLLHSSQLPGIDARLGLPKRSDVADEEPLGGEDREGKPGRKGDADGDEDDEQ